MAQSPKIPTPLSDAALVFEQELARYEKLTSELRRTPVRSEKSLQRTKRLLTEAADSEEQLGVRLGGLVQAMNGARELQQICLSHLLEAAQMVQARAAELTALLERVAALGQSARDIHVPVANVMADKANGASPADLLTSLEQVSARMDTVLGDADGILRASEDGDWPEIAREVRTLKQQVQTARTRVAKACVDVASQVPH